MKVATSALVLAYARRNGCRTALALRQSALAPFLARAMRRAASGSTKAAIVTAWPGLNSSYPEGNFGGNQPLEILNPTPYIPKP